MMDVSDGLLLDCRACARRAAAAPTSTSTPCRLSRAFIAERGQHREARLFAATGGDDYALLAALPADDRPVKPFFTNRHDNRRRSGTLAEAAGIRLADAAGPVELPETLGYEHRRN